MKTYFRKMTVGCGCRDKQCGKLYIQFVGNNLVEFNFIPYKCKKVKFGVVVSDKDLDKFRKIIFEQSKKI